MTERVYSVLTTNGLGVQGLGFVKHLTFYVAPVAGFRRSRLQVSEGGLGL